MESLFVGINGKISSAELKKKLSFNQVVKRETNMHMVSHYLQFYNNPLLLRNSRFVSTLELFSLYQNLVIY